MNNVIPTTTEEGLSRFWASLTSTGPREDKENSDFTYDEVESTGFEKADARNDEENFISNLSNQAMDLHTLINSHRK